MTAPSQRLRGDIDELVNLASRAPPAKGRQSWQHHAQNIELVLTELDQGLRIMTEDTRDADVAIDIPADTNTGCEEWMLAGWTIPILRSQTRCLPIRRESAVVIAGGRA
jgi:hypothetical protein